ncbi:uncharacterized protein EV420DRAFT_1521924 [Desarmillaria tabescens]|uniref:F-box domain-containing protein n=1 Tax=Armillaria tabescens TaxID=1929756 RepID=A0AA39TYA5_ARMTA|nr:uncharacterized protein EV420DRAFT_1521924 [Desarmillaria tabescens]KAK0462960.1 hypothetical protein EV420DRAFT_1521924 [Desarmillaria tabescens]
MDMQETFLNPGQLPEDIVVGVFHELLKCNDVETLSSCAIVCRSWSCIAQDALFSGFDIILESAYVPVYKLLSFLPVPRRIHTVDNFVDFIGANPRLVDMVRNLRLRVPARTALLEVDTNVGPIFSVVRRLHKLRSLSIDAKCFCGIAPDAVLPQSDTMTRLFLRDVAFPHVGKIMELVSSVPKLEDLSLIGSGPAAVFEENVETPSHLTLQPPLRRLVIHMGHMVIASLINGTLLRINGLRHLDIHFVDGLSEDGIHSLVELIGLNESTLQSLCLLDGLPRDVLMSLIPNLRLRSLEVYPFRGAVLELLTVLHDTFDCIADNTLENITIVIDGDYLLYELGDHSVAWERLQTSLRSFPRLRMFCVLLTREPYEYAITDLTSSYVTVEDFKVHPAFSELRKDGKMTVGEKVY